MSQPQVFLCPILNGDTQLNANGLVSVGGTIWAYFAGTNTLCNTFTTVSADTYNPNPIVIGSNGGLDTQIWIPAGQYTDFFIYDSSNNQLDFIGSVLGNGDGSILSNTANLAFFVANAAFALAEKATSVAVSSNENSNNAYAAANAAANTVLVESNSTLVLAAANLNFFNSPTTNAVVTANGTGGQVNIGFSANTVYLGVNGNSSNSANGYANVTANSIIQFGSIYYASAPAHGSTEPATINFPEAFKLACYSVIVTMDGDGVSGDNGYVPRVNNITYTQFQLYFDAIFEAAFPTGGANIWWVAIGV